MEMETPRPLTDTHALVTGGGRGIGAAVALWSTTDNSQTALTNHSIAVV